MTILMCANKQLVITNYTRMYQRESVVDKLYFLVPIKYEDNDLTTFSIYLEYATPSLETRIEELMPDEEIYKDSYIRLTLPVDSKFTNLAGEVKLKLTMTKIDNEISTKYVLHTGTVSVTIETWEDYFAFTPSETLSAIDNRLLEVDNEIEKLKSLSEQLSLDLVDDLALNGTLLQVTAKGVLKGEGVEIVTNIDDPDDKEDAVIDLSTLRTVEL